MDERMSADELALFTSIVIAEQNNYWMRFTAFSALNAALMVVAASDDVAPIVGAFGLVLSIIWSFVQWASYNYVIHYDKKWEPQIEAKGFRSKDKAFWAGLTRTTTLGVHTTILSALFWLAYTLRPDWFG